MPKELPLHLVPILRGPTAQALFDAVEAMTRALAAIDPDIRAKPYGWTALSHLPGRERHCMLLSSNRAPLDPISMIDDTARRIVAQARAMGRKQDTDVLVYHFPNGIGLVAIHQARAARTRRKLLAHASLIVPSAPTQGAAIARHDELRKMSRFWLGQLCNINADAAAGLVCPRVDRLHESPCPIDAAA